MTPEREARAKLEELSRDEPLIRTALEYQRAYGAEDREVYLALAIALAQSLIATRKIAEQAISLKPIPTLIVDLHPTPATLPVQPIEAFAVRDIWAGSQPAFESFRPFAGAGRIKEVKP